MNQLPNIDSITSEDRGGGSEVTYVTTTSGKVVCITSDSVFIADTMDDIDGAVGVDIDTTDSVTLAGAVNIRP